MRLNIASHVVLKKLKFGTLEFKSVNIFEFLGINFLLLRSFLIECTGILRTHIRRPPVAERLRALFLNHSIISPLCLVWVRALRLPHVRQAKSCLQVCQVVFLGGSPIFAPPTDWPVSYELK